MQGTKKSALECGLERLFVDLAVLVESYLLFSGRKADHKAIEYPITAAVDFRFVG